MLDLSPCWICWEMLGRIGCGLADCQEDALIVYEGGLAEEAQCTAPPGPVLVKAVT